MISMIHLQAGGWNSHWVFRCLKQKLKYPILANEEWGVWAKKWKHWDRSTFKWMTNCLSLVLSISFLVRSVLTLCYTIGIKREIWKGTQCFKYYVKYSILMKCQCISVNMCSVYSNKFHVKWKQMAPFLLLKCSKTCGRGARRREVLCKNSAAETVSESLCSGSPRPESQEGCVLGRCPKNNRLQWVASSWSEVWVWAYWRRGGGALHIWPFTRPHPHGSFLYRHVPGATSVLLLCIVPWLETEKRCSSCFLFWFSPTHVLAAPTFIMGLLFSVKPLWKLQGYGS